MGHREGRKGRGAEIAGEGGAEPAQILDDEGTIPAVLGPDCFNLRVGGVEATHDNGRIAGQGVKREENHEGGEEQRRHRPPQRGEHDAGGTRRRGTEHRFAVHGAGSCTSPRHLREREWFSH